jgi:hypothetical protein
MSRIDEKIDKYLVGEAIDTDELKRLAKKYKTSHYHEEANDVAGEVQRLMRFKDKGSIKKYLKSVIDKGVPSWNEEAVEAAEAMLDCF